jgi:nucleotide-binding universal stress UspA family protein
MTSNSKKSVTKKHDTDRPILVAVDFSEQSRETLYWACEFASCKSANLILLHVIHDSASKPGFYLGDPDDPMQSMETVAENMLKDFLADAIRERPDLDVLKSAGIQLAEGLPAGRIVEVADLMDALLIVVGSRGLTGLPHVLLGSVAERVVELATRAVAVIKPAKPEPESNDEE